MSLVSAMLNIEYAMQCNYSYTLLIHIPILKRIGGEKVRDPPLVYASLAKLLAIPYLSSHAVDSWRAHSATFRKLNDHCQRRQVHAFPE